jgi:hypothetical protein
LYLFEPPNYAIAKVLFINSLEFMKKIALLIGVFILFGAVVSAQSRKFIWEDEICAFEGVYNARKYTKKQLENTYQLYYSQQFDLQTYQFSFSNEQGLRERWTVEALDAEYARKSEALRKLEVVNVPFWKAFKAKKLKALEQDYHLTRVSVQAFQNPSALKEITFADACVKRFAPPLIAGGDELLRIWREVKAESWGKNADPEKVRKDFEAKLASADKFKDAQLDVLTYGWWNCVNAQIIRGDESVASKSFWKLFRRVKRLGCDYA